jgi:O-antigen/teichoic acid export membrane protein
MLREIAKYKSDKNKIKKVINNVITLELGVVASVFTIALIIAKFWPKANEIIFVIFLVEIHELFNTFNSLSKTIYNSYEQNDFKLYSIVIEKGLSFILGAAALIANQGLYGLLVALIIAKAITAIFNYFLLRKKFIQIRPSINIKYYSQLIKKSIPFWFSLVFTILYYHIDKIMLTGMKGFTVTGWYSAASTLINALIFIPGVIVNATFPAMSRFHHTNSKDFLNLLYKKSFYYLISIGIPLTVGITLLAQRLIIFIYKSQFLESAVILRILSLSLVLIFVNCIMGYLLNSINKQHLYTISNGVCAFSNIILNFILIPRFSYIGAAVATIICQSINFGLLYYFTTKNNYSINLIKISYKPLIAGILMGVLIIYIKSLAIVYIVPIAAIFYFVALFLMKGLGKEEIELIKSFLPKRLK